MKHRIPLRFPLISSFVVCTLCGSLAAQRPGESGTNYPSSNETRPGPPANYPDIPSINQHGPSFIVGKVTVSDGTPLTDSAVIQSVCSGLVRSEARTDLKGNFSFQTDNSPNSGIAGIDQVDVDSSSQGLPGESTKPGSRRDLSRCDLQAVLPGFRSQPLTLAGKVQDSGTANVGTLVLQRMKEVEGFTISATSAAAPGNAKHAYEKGREEERKGKWDAAGEQFSKAVEIYPNYAVAWLELGHTQLQKHDEAAAKASFRHALDADSKFTSPYVELARLAVEEKQWIDVVQITDSLLKLNPVSYPQQWFYNSMAHYYLYNWDEAEKAAQQGLTVDVQHQVPRLEYLLAMILVQKKDYEGAILHMRTYVRLAPNASDLDAAQKQIAALEKVTAQPAEAAPKSSASQ